MGCSRPAPDMNTIKWSLYRMFAMFCPPCCLVHWCAGILTRRCKYHISNIYRAQKPQSDNDRSKYLVCLSYRLLWASPTQRLLTGAVKVRATPYRCAARAGVNSIMSRDRSSGSSAVLEGSFLANVVKSIKSFASSTPAFFNL